MPIKRKTRRVVTHWAGLSAGVVMGILRGLEIFVQMRHHSEQREYGLDRKTSQQYIFDPLEIVQSPIRLTGRIWPAGHE